MDTKIQFEVVAKAHAICAWFFAIVFFLASFGVNFPIIGPAALLNGWDVTNPSLVYMARFLVGLLTGIGLFEWVFCSNAATKQPYVWYHGVLSVLMLYSSVSAANGALGWLYAILITLFFIAGILGTTEDSAPVESSSNDSKTPMVAMSHAVCAVFFGAVFLFATFSLSLPILGPAALLHKWHMDNPALVYCARFVAGLLFGIAFFEWIFAKAVKIQPSFNIYHAVTAVLALYSSVAAAKGALGWLYASLITAFLVAGLVAERM